MMDYKPCQTCGVASLIGMDGECEGCWEIKTRIQCISLSLLVKLIKEEWSVERTNEFRRILGEEEQE